MNLDLSGKRAVVCGSTQGIGKAIAMELASLGAAVTLLARNEERLRAVMNELPRNAGQDHHFLVADFAQPETVRTAIHPYTSNHDVQILVNNTGGPPGGRAIDADPEAFAEAYAMHVVCNQILVKACLEGMKRARYGRIINVISTSVKVPIRGLGVSNTVRGAVASWAKTLASELGSYGITVNNLLPGSFETGRMRDLVKTRAKESGRTEEEILESMIREIPVGRIGDPSEIAAAAAFLASPSASYINGINLPVDGGRTPTL
ncbi:MAG: SDR family oxidoreductase [Bacteroidota bacterium]|jgi:3-oxoacyl-[acyl-carrier protein] reductase|nr:MAG: short-chain dehydrogenase [Bacteroidota bacterium]